MAREDKHDLKLVAGWLERQGLSAKPIQHRRNRQTPDFECAIANEVVAYCEVKSRQAARWRHEDGTSDGLVPIGHQGKDATFNSLAKYVLEAHEQISSVDPTHVQLWAVAIVNHDCRITFSDLRETLTGDFFATDGKRCATLKNVSEGEIKDVKFEVDLYLWFELDRVITVLGEANSDRKIRTQEIFGLAEPQVRWESQP